MKFGIVRYNYQCLQLECTPHVLFIYGNKVILVSCETAKCWFQFLGGDRACYGESSLNRKNHASVSSYMKRTKQEMSEMFYSNERA